MHRLVLLIAVLAVLLGVPRGAAGERNLTIDVQNHAVTLRAVEVPLETILRELTAATGITFNLHEAATERLSLDLAAVGVEEALKRLFAHRSTLFLYEGPDIPATVFVFGLRPARYRSPASGEAGDAVEPAVSDELTVLPDIAAEVHAIEERLHDASGTASPDGTRLLQQLFDAPELSAQITALQWLAGDHEVLIDAAASALKDGDYLVQEVAREMLLERGADENRLDEILAAARVEDVSTIRRMVNALIVSP